MTYSNSQFLIRFLFCLLVWVLTENEQGSQQLISSTYNPWKPMSLSGKYVNVQFSLYGLTLSLQVH